MVPSEILQQTFMIRTPWATGTAFTISFDKRQYLITAKHVLSKGAATAPGTSDLEIRHARTWKALPFKLVGEGPDPHDVTVLALPHILIDFLPVAVGAKSIYLSQDVFFVGFPFNLHGDIGPTNNDYPLPYVKKGIVAMIEHPAQGQHCLVLDGHTNPGFSGGPVVFRNSETQQIQIAAVVSGYSSTREPVYVANSDEHSGFTVSENAGLIDACPVDRAIELIQANPIGAPTHR